MENNNESDKDYSPDLYYKKLFSHSFLIKELLYLIFEEKLYTFGFDFDTLKLEKNDFVFEFENVLIERKSDCIWSIQLKEKRFIFSFTWSFKEP